MEEAKLDIGEHGDRNLRGDLILSFFPSISKKSFVRMGMAKLELDLPCSDSVHKKSSPQDSIYNRKGFNTKSKEHFHEQPSTLSNELLMHIQIQDLSVDGSRRRHLDRTVAPFEKKIASSRVSGRCRGRERRAMRLHEGSVLMDTAACILSAKSNSVCMRDACQARRT
uniref:Uncharacterized protein n=1 Tax=Oryza glumipatula TaxID=40148 RepID=A0A0D9YNN1_9ORYZ